MAEEKSTLLEVYALDPQGLRLLSEMEETLASIDGQFLRDKLRSSFVKMGARRMSTTGLNFIDPTPVVRYGLMIPSENQRGPTDDGSRENSTTSEAVDLSMSEDEWSEATIVAMTDTAKSGFVPPEEHLSSIRTLMKRATSRDV